jgi:hypothetical protein
MLILSWRRSRPFDEDWMGSLENCGFGATHGQTPDSRSERQGRSLGDKRFHLPVKHSKCSVHMDYHFTRGASQMYSKRYVNRTYTNGNAGNTVTIIKTKSGMITALQQPRGTALKKLGRCLRDFCCVWRVEGLNLRVDFTNARKHHYLCH